MLAGEFTDLGALGLPGVERGPVAWGDYDNDGDLDILLTGQDSGSTQISRAYRNDSATANSVPNAPSGLTSNVNSPTSVTLSWTAPADGQTPTNGLSYNLRVGTTPGGSDIVAPMSFQNPPSSQTDGLRKISQRGLVQGTTWTLDDLTPGQTYYWSVQAVDTALAGSLFAAEGSVEICSSGVSNTNDSGSGSLRSAIACANSLAGVQTIDFNIAGAGPHTIQPLSALPTITDAVIIDGTTEPDFAGTPVVELNGTSAGAGANGLTVNAAGAGSTIRGLVPWTAST